MKILKLPFKTPFKVDDIINYSDLVSAEGINLQRGMNFNVNQAYSIFLMSVRENAPYSDKWNEENDTLIYEGHDARKDIAENPKNIDQPMYNPKGTLTENGKFYIAAHAYKINLLKEPHKIKVYEKVKDGIWCYKGFFNLIDANIINTAIRNVFKFYLQPVEVKSLHKNVIIPHNRLIPTDVKIEVWKRDQGKCVICGSTKNLHYDHNLPFSKGGTSLTSENVRILCMKCNLKKASKILFAPITFGI
jgi:hypothetical protein